MLATLEIIHFSRYYVTNMLLRAGFDQFDLNAPCFSWLEVDAWQGSGLSCDVSADTEQTCRQRTPHFKLSDTTDNQSANTSSGGVGWGLKQLPWLPWLTCATHILGRRAGLQSGPSLESSVSSAGIHRPPPLGAGGEPSSTHLQNPQPYLHLTSTSTALPA